MQLDNAHHICCQTTLETLARLQKQLTSVRLAIATNGWDAGDPPHLERAGLTQKATTETPLVHQCNDEVGPCQQAGLQLPDG